MIEYSPYVVELHSLLIHSYNDSIFDLGLLGNYGNMTEDDIGMLISAIQSNLTLAEQVIEQGTQQTQDLVNIQNSFLAVS